MKHQVHIVIEGEVVSVSWGRFSYRTVFYINEKLIESSTINSYQSFATRSEAEDKLKVWCGFLSELLSERIRDEHERRQRPEN